MEKILNPWWVILVLLIGGIASTSTGGYLLFISFQQEFIQIIPFFLCLCFFTFGLSALINLLDSWFLKISDQKIVIGSIFRKREIERNQILSFSEENYKRKYLSGKRLKIFSKDEKSTIFYDYHKGYRYIKDFVKHKDLRKNGFRREHKLNDLFTDIFIVLICSILFSVYFFCGTDEKEEMSYIQVYLLEEMKIGKKSMSFQSQKYPKFKFIADINEQQNQSDFKAGKNLMIRIKKGDYEMKLLRTREPDFFTKHIDWNRIRVYDID